MIIGIAYDLPLKDNKKEMISAVKKALQKKYKIKDLPFDDKFIESAKEVDLVFNLSTGGGKSSRQLHVPSILDTIGIPFTGSSPSVHAICMDKGITKMLIEKANIPTPKFVRITPYDEIPDIDFYPAFVKPSCEGSAKGVSSDSLVKNKKELEKKVLNLLKEVNGPIIIEEFIDGREFSVGIIGNKEKIEVLPILEIDFSMLPEGVERFYSYRVKHFMEKDTVYKCPANIEKEQEETLKTYIKKLAKILNISDYARIDVRGKNRNFYILEVNSLPLLVPGYSDITKMLVPYGMCYDDFILKIIDVTRERYGI